MDPKTVSRRLRLIAAGIDKSKNPSHRIAVEYIKRIIAALEDTEEEAGILAPQTEYSIQLDLSLSADFEGNVDKQALINKFKADLTAAIRSGMSTTAKELKLNPIGARVQPINIECAVTETEPEPVSDPVPE
jgi:hypothetical protein